MKIIFKKYTLKNNKKFRIYKNKKSTLYTKNETNPPVLYICEFTSFSPMEFLTKFIIKNFNYKIYYYNIFIHIYLSIL